MCRYTPSLYGAAFAHNNRIVRLSDKLLAFQYYAVLVHYARAEAHVLRNNGVLHYNAVFYDGTLFHRYAAEQNAVFHLAVNHATVGNETGTYFGVVHVARGNHILDLGQYGSVDEPLFRAAIERIFYVEEEVEDDGEGDAEGDDADDAEEDDADDAEGDEAGDAEVQ